MFGPGLRPEVTGVLPGSERYKRVHGCLASSECSCSDTLFAKDLFCLVSHHAPSVASPAVKLDKHRKKTNTKTKQCQQNKTKQSKTNKQNSNKLQFALKTDSA